jgi:hypothetical protein
LIKLSIEYQEFVDLVLCLKVVSQVCMDCRLAVDVPEDHAVELVPATVVAHAVVVVVVVVALARHRHLNFWTLVHMVISVDYCFHTIFYQPAASRILATTTVEYHVHMVVLGFRHDLHVAPLAHYAHMAYTNQLPTWFLTRLVLYLAF